MVTELLKGSCCQKCGCLGKFKGADGKPCGRTPPNGKGCKLDWSRSWCPCCMEEACKSGLLPKWTPWVQTALPRQFLDRFGRFWDI